MKLNCEEWTDLCRALVATEPAVRPLLMLFLRMKRAQDPSIGTWNGNELSADNELSAGNANQSKRSSDEDPPPPWDPADTVS